MACGTVLYVMLRPVTISATVAIHELKVLCTFADSLCSFSLIVAENDVIPPLSWQVTAEQQAKIDSVRTSVIAAGFGDLGNHRCSRLLSHPLCRSLLTLSLLLSHICDSR